MRTSVVWPLALLVAACGARSGLSIDSPPELDAGTGFDTFPCRWSLGGETEVARSRRAFVALEGAVHGSRDEVVVLGRPEGDETWTGALLGSGDPAMLVRRFDRVRGGRLHGHTGGYAQVVDCELLFFDEMFEETSRLRFSAGVSCALEPQDKHWIDATVLEPLQLRILRFDPSGAPVDERLLAPLSDDGAAERSVRFAGMDPWIVLAVAGGRLWGRGPAEVPIDLGVEAGPIDAARDTLRPAAVVLRRPAPGAVQIDRVRAADLRVEPLASSIFFGSAPSGHVVTNETEALVPLHDGSVLIAPLSGSDVRFLGPVSSIAVDELTVVLRAGESAGGLLYSHVLVGGDHALAFRPLVCNR